MLWWAVVAGYKRGDLMVANILDGSTKYPAYRIKMSKNGTCIDVIQA